MELLTTLDYVLFVLLMIGGIWGAIKGFLEEVSMKFGYVIGFTFALMFTHLLSPVFQDKFGFPIWFSAFVSYFSIFMVGYIVIKVLGSILIGIVDTANLTAVDNLLGFFLGLVEAFVLIAAFEFLLSNQNLFNLSEIFEQSLFSSKLIKPLIDIFTKTIRG